MLVYWLKRIAALAVLLALVLALGPYTVAAQCPGNIAVNPGFEEGFSERGAGEVTVANGWHPFWQDGPGVEEGYNKRPEYKPEIAAIHGTRRVHSGNYAQKWFTTYGTHNAGVYQQINVPAGSLVNASVYAQAWSSDFDDITRSEGTYRLYIGIDPTGGTNFASGSVVWSPANSTTDQWVQLSVQARAQADTITVFLRGAPEYRNKHNDAYFDDVCVTVAAPPTPTPAPTNTPGPTNTPTPTATPENTPTPANTPTPKPTATPRSATILLAAFEDRNGDGSRGPDDPLLSGVLIELRNAQGEVIATRHTDSATDPYAFEGLAPGEYDIVVTPAEGYVSAHAGPISLGLIAGALRELHIAQVPAPEPTPTPEPTATPQPEPTPQPDEEPAEDPVPTPGPGPASPGTTLAEYTGLIIVAIALVLIAIVVIVRMQQPKE